MRNHDLRLFIAFLISTVLIYTPILQAAELSLPSGDLVAPQVSHTVIPGTLEAGSSLLIKAKVTDNVGVKAVTLFYRTKGTKDYKRAAMERIGNSDEYSVTLGKDNLVAPGIEYYIQAMDLAGNSVLHGYSFSPLTVNVVPPVVPTPKEAVAKKAPTSTEIIREEPKAEKKKSKTWLWIALGALVVGAIAAGSGGSSGGGDTGTVAVSGPSP